MFSVCGREKCVRLRETVCVRESKLYQMHKANFLSCRWGHNSSTSCAGGQEAHLLRFPGGRLATMQSLEGAVLSEWKPGRKFLPEPLVQ